MSQKTMLRLDKSGIDDIKYLIEKKLEQVYIEDLLETHDANEVAEQMLCYKQSGVFDFRIEMELQALKED